MGGAVLQFAGSLAAVMLLVLVVHLAGFSLPARLKDEAEARELARLAPGGFAAQRIALDREGCGAIMADAAGRLLVLRPLGGKFVPLLVDRAALRAEGERLIIATGARPVSLRLDGDSANWPSLA